MQPVKFQLSCCLLQQGCFSKRHSIYGFKNIHPVHLVKHRLCSDTVGPKDLKRVFSEAEAGSVVQHDICYACAVGLPDSGALHCSIP